MHGEQKAPVEDRGRGPRRRSGRAHPTKKVKGPEFLQNVGMDTEQAEELKNMLGGAFAADKEKEITDEKDD